jgi:hypothetical protein
MITFGRKVNNDYGWEITLFHKLREFSDGVTFLEAKINWDRYIGDHTPRFEFHLVLLNHTIIEVNVYYLHHRSKEDE